MVEEKSRKISQTEIYSKALEGYKPQLKTADVKALEQKYERQADVLYQRRLGIVGSQVSGEVGKILNEGKEKYEKSLQKWKKEIESLKAQMEKAKETYETRAMRSPKYEADYRKTYEKVVENATKRIRENELSILSTNSSLSYVNKYVKQYNEIKDNPEKLLETFDKDIAKTIISNAGKIGVAEYKYETKLRDALEKQAEEKAKVIKEDKPKIDLTPVKGPPIILPDKVSSKQEYYDPYLGIMIMPGVPGTTKVGRALTMEEVDKYVIGKEEKLKNDLEKLYKEGPKYETIKVPTYGTIMPEDKGGPREQLIDVNKVKIAQLEKQLNKIQGNTPQKQKLVNELEKLYKAGPKYETVKTPAYGTIMPEDKGGLREQLIDVNKIKINNIKRQLNKIQGYNSVPVVTAIANTIIYKRFNREIQDLYFNVKGRVKKSDKTTSEFFNILFDEYTKSSFFTLNFLVPLAMSTSSIVYSKGGLRLPIENRWKIELDKFKNVYKEELSTIKAKNEYIKLTTDILPYMNDLQRISEMNEKHNAIILSSAQDLSDIGEKLDKLKSRTAEYNVLVNEYYKKFENYKKLINSYSEFGKEVQQLYDKIGFKYSVKDFNMPEVDDTIFNRLEKEMRNVRQKLIDRGANPIEAFVFDITEQLTKEIVTLALFIVTVNVTGSIVSKFITVPQKIAKKSLTITENIKKFDKAIRISKIQTAAISVLTPIAITSSATMAYVNELAISGRTDYAIVRGIASGLVTSAVLLPNVYKSYKTLNELTSARNYLEAYKYAYNLNVVEQQKQTAKQIYSKDFRPKQLVYTEIDDIKAMYNKLPVEVKQRLGSVENIKKLTIQIETTKLVSKPYIVVRDAKDTLQYYVMRGPTITKYFNIYAVNSTGSLGSSTVAIAGVEKIPAITQTKPTFDSIERFFKYATHKRLFMIDSIAGTDFYIMTDSKIVTTKDGVRYTKLTKDSLHLGEIQKVNLNELSPEVRRELIFIRKIPMPLETLPQDLSTTQQMQEYWSRLERVGLKTSYRVVIQDVLKPTPANLNLFADINYIALINSRGDVVITSSNFKAVTLTGTEIYSKGVVLDKNQKVIVNLNKAYKDFLKYYGTSERMLLGNVETGSGALSGGSFGSGGIGSDGGSGMLSGGSLFGLRNTRFANLQLDTSITKSFTKDNIIDKSEIINLLNQARNKGYIEFTVGELKKYSNSAKQLLLQNMELRNMLISVPSLSNIRPLSFSADIISIISSTPTVITSAQVVKLGKLSQTLYDYQYNFLKIQPLIVQLQQHLTNPLAVITEDNLRFFSNRVQMLQKQLQTVSNIRQDIQNYITLLRQYILQMILVKQMHLAHQQHITMQQYKDKLKHIMHTVPTMITKQINPQTQTLSNLITQQQMLQLQLNRLRNNINKRKVQTTDAVTPTVNIPVISPIPPISDEKYEDDRGKKIRKKDKRKLKITPKYIGYVKEVRKKNKWELLPGIYSTYVEAMASGISYTSVTLRASFRIKKVNKKPNKRINQFAINYALSILKERFYKSEKEPGVWIEKKSYRLSTKQEVKAIQEAKKRAEETKRKAEETRRFWFER